MLNESNLSPSCQARLPGRRIALPRLALSQVLLDDHTTLLAERFYRHNQHVTETSAPWSMDDLVQALDEALMITSGSFSTVSTPSPLRCTHRVDNLVQSALVSNPPVDGGGTATTTTATATTSSTSSTTTNATP